MINLLSFAQVLSEPAANPKKETESVSRRNWLRGLGVGLGATGLAETLLAAPDYGAGSTNVKLLRRITYGPTEEEVAVIKAYGFSRYLSQQLAHTTINDSASESVVAQRYPRVFMTSPQLAAIGDDWITSEQMREATIYRALKSKRQLHAKMVEFWTDHFNVHIDKPGGWLFVPMHNAIRTHALGNFKNLLMAIAKSPSMLYYLDNTENYGDFGNVNFARELMELHTISVAGGYTPTDIRNVQRAFSGWEFSWQEGPNQGLFLFDEDKHSTLPKTVLGTAIPGNGQGGVAEGEFVLNLLANHASTAKHISRKLIRFFLNYEPSQALVDHVAATFTWSRGDIKACLKRILTTRTVAEAPAKLKRPYHMILSGLRSLKANFNNEAWTLKYEYIDRAGQLPFAWEPPDGYPDRLDFWSNLVLPRWNFSLSMMKGYVWGTSFNMQNLLKGATTVDQVVTRINVLFFAGEMQAIQKAAIRSFLAAAPLNQERIRAAFALAMASPNFQWH